MQDTQEGHKQEFHVPGLVPENEHCSQGAPGTEDCSTDKRMFRNPVRVHFCAKFIENKHKKRKGIQAGVQEREDAGE